MKNVLVPFLAAAAALCLVTPRAVAAATSDTLWVCSAPSTQVVDRVQVTGVTVVVLPTGKLRIQMASVWLNATGGVVRASSVTASQSDLNAELGVDNYSVSKLRAAFLRLAARCPFN